MQIRITLPFIDIRRFDLQLSQYVIDKINWPFHNEKSFVRCCGERDPNRRAINLHRAMSFTSDVISKINPEKRTLSFPFGNQIIGIYSIILNIPGYKYRKMSAIDIIDYLDDNLNISLRILFDNPKIESNHSITKIPAKILTLKDKMSEHYYYSTLKFREKNPLKEIDPNVPEWLSVVDPSKSTSKNSIYFLIPIITIDNSNLADSKIKNVPYFYFKKKITVGQTLYKRKIILYHFRRGMDPFIPWKRVEISEDNNDIENFILCDSGLNACIILLEKFKASHDIDMLSTTISSIIDFCKIENKIFGIYKTTSDKYSLLLGIKNAINSHKSLPKEIKDKLCNGVNELIGIENNEVIIN